LKKESGNNNSELKPKTDKLPNDRYVNQVDLSKILLSSKANVSKLCKSKFKHAIGSDKKIDTQDPIVRSHIELRLAKLNSVNDQKETVEKVRGKAKHQQTANDGFFKNQSINFDQLENLTIRQIVEKHSSISGFKIYVESLRSLSDYKNKELKYLQTRRSLIEIDPLAESLFSLIDLAFKRIVGEYPSSISSQLRAIALSNKSESLVEMIDLQEKTLSKILRECKKEISKSINEMRNNKRSK